MLSISNLKMPKRTCEIQFDAAPLASDGNLIILQHDKHLLGLYDIETFALLHEIDFLSTDSWNIIDLHWSTCLKSFLILAHKYLYTLHDTRIYKTPVTKMNDDFCSLTSDDDNSKLFLATSRTIQEYSFTAFTLSKQYEITEFDIYSLRFNTNTKHFGLTLRSRIDRKWSFQIKDRSMNTLWSVPTSIHHGSCLVSILFSSNEWLIINHHGDILFHITSDGKIKADVIYGGRMLLNAIEINKKFLVFRTIGFLEKYY